MWPISQAFVEAISAGYTIATDLTFLDNGAPIGGAKGAATDGQITISRSATNRRTLSLTIALATIGGLPDLSLIPPPNNQGAATPFGNEVYPRFGWKPPDGDVELVPMGVFVMETVTVNDTGSTITMTITGYDRSYLMGLFKFTSPYVVAKATKYDAAMSALVDLVLPGVQQSIYPTTLALAATQTFNENTDPWSAIQTLATAIGYEAYFDVQGGFVARPIPDPTTAPTVWYFVASTPTSTMQSASKVLSRQGVSNDFIVQGSGTNVTPPIRGRAQDTDVNSPMYVGGIFGDVPTYVTSSLVNTSAQADAAAANQLAASLGQADQATITANPNPAFDIDDVWYCQRTRAGIDGYYVTDTAVLSLRHDGVTTLTGRRIT